MPDTPVGAVTPLSLRVLTPPAAHGPRVPAAPLPRGWKAAPPLFCPCGLQEATVAGLCRACYDRNRHDERAFGGQRHAALVRDGFRCRTCPTAAADDPCPIVVHHRCPGVHALDTFITLCARCHGLVTHLPLPQGWLPPLLLALWREQHPDAPDQGQFTFDAWTPPPLILVNEAAAAARPELTEQASDTTAAAAPQLPWDVEIA